MDNQAIKKQHQTGIWGLLRLYPRDLLYRGAKWPLVITTLLFVSFIFMKMDSQKLVTSIVDVTISVMPSLLGFLLGGYTILISFANSDLLKLMTKKTSNRDISVFQMLSCIFALTILLQSATLALALIARFSMLNEIDFTGLSWLSYTMTGFNYLFGFILLSLLLYTIFAFRDIITNIFNMTQLFHQSLLLQRLASERQAEELSRKEQNM